MSRGDAWSVAVTLIATGGAYFIGGKTAALVCLIVGSVIAVVLHFTKPSRKEGSSGRLVAQHVGNGASLRTGNMKTGDVNVSIGWPTPQSPTAPSAEKPTKRPAPRVKFLGEEVIDVSWFGNDQQEMIVSPIGQNIVKALVARYRNDVSGLEKSADGYAKANLILRDQDDKEIGHGILGALWFDDRQPAEYFELEMGQGGCVVILVKGHSGYLIPWKRPQTTEFGRILLTELVELKEKPKTIEVRLIGNDGLLLPPTVIDTSKHQL